jgi:hypothetical protein
LFVCLFVLGAVIGFSFAHTWASPITDIGLIKPRPPALGGRDQTKIILVVLAVIGI